ncbi:hypothetical protein CDL15_Pgr001559 [Punica granatum]|uniref:Uncharacterized protein n=1 Tax=Punica granatum TaxID=22663 RepID=A0A218X5D6_PUNGR|nr:hypothetical protein CDL15_Pgr001559 [Punica granatum]
MGTGAGPVLRAGSPNPKAAPHLHRRIHYTTKTSEPTPSSVGADFAELQAYNRPARAGTVTGALESVATCEPLLLTMWPGRLEVYCHVL